MSGFSGGGGGAQPDNVTINFNNSGQLQVKDLGVSTAKLADLAVSTAKLADSSVTPAKLGFITLIKVAEVSLSAAATSITITSLNGNADGIYFIWMVYNNNVANRGAFPLTTVYVYPNNDTNAANYITQKISAN
jgi:hypothetical protein